MTNLATCRFCKRPYNADFCTEEEHERYCPENPANWEVSDSGKQLAWAIFWVFAAIAAVGLFFTFLSDLSENTDHVVFEMSDCVAATAEEQGFAGDAQEQWELFAEFCNK